MSVQDRNTNILNTLKVWLFPSLLSIVSMLILRDISELRADVKQLLAQSNIDKTKIENLERILYNKKLTASYTTPDKLLFKHEDLYDINNYLPQ